MKLVILDCDGTLVDSQNGICLAMAYAFTKLGLEQPSRAATLAVVGLSLPEAFAVLAPRQTAKMRSSLADHYRAAFTELKRDADQHEPLFDGVRGAIEAFAQRDDIVLGIATGKSRRGIDRLFEREGWRERFLTVQTADEHPSKPHPGMVLQAMAEAGTGPSSTVMVGDTTYDVEMALAAGVGALGVAWGYHPAAELRLAGAHAVIEACGGLPAGIDAYFTGRERAA